MRRIAAILVAIIAAAAVVPCALAICVPAQAGGCCAGACCCGQARGPERPRPATPPLRGGDEALARLVSASTGFGPALVATAVAPEPAGAPARDSQTAYLAACAFRC